MTVMVAFDGSALSEAALRRGAELGDTLDTPLVATSVVPTDPLYARKQGWVMPEATYDPETQAESLASRVAELAPEASFNLETLGHDVGPRDVAKQLRATAYDMDAEVVVLGSENAGRVVSPVSSVADTVVSSVLYDVYIVRDAAD